MISSDVWERKGAGEIERSTFYFIMGCILTWGFVATYIVSNMTQTWRPGIGEFLIVGLVLPVIGIVMSSSSSALLSLVGFHLVVIPFGAILGPTLAIYNVAHPGIVGKAAILTAGVTGVMALSGLMFPKFYSSIGGALFSALLALVFVQLLSFIIPALRDVTLIHYLAAGLFSLYIGFDMWRASEVPATMDNAVDVCIALYLDIINLFLWILRILGGSSSSD